LSFFLDIQQTAEYVKFKSQVRKGEKP